MKTLKMVHVKKNPQNTREPVVQRWDIYHHHFNFWAPSFSTHFLIWSPDLAIFKFER